MLLTVEVWAGTRARARFGARFGAGVAFGVATRRSSRTRSVGQRRECMLLLVEVMAGVRFWVNGA